MKEIIENFHPCGSSAEGCGRDCHAAGAEKSAADEVHGFAAANFVPAEDRLLLKRLPPREEGLIVRPQITVEQSEYGVVIAVGDDVYVPLGVVAKFSRFSAEEIHFEDEQPGEEYVLAYKHDIRGWFLATDGCA